MHKIFKSIDEQITLLRDNRGLDIDDEDYARKCLTEFNYYRLSGYSLTLRKNDKFYKGTKFSEIMQIYNFDKAFKALILNYLEDIEISLRTHVAYELGKQDTDPEEKVSYNREENYISKEHFKKFSAIIGDEISSSRDEPFVKHHQRKYEGVLPVWAMVETLSFGKISTLFSSLNNDLKKQICDLYYHGLRYTVVENLMEGLVVIRNICAHHSRLYNRGLPLKPQFSTWEYDYFEKLSYERGSIGNKAFFRLLVIIRLSSDNNIATTIIEDIEKLQKEYPFVDLKHYGFHKDWKKIIAHLSEEYKKASN